ncbi:hypothetical protein Tco_0438197 [Tanacetum coccineum]|uniref:Uncharacterized protein n=1 Tax=Tanacetum coccineum TaxID=301880 RepID=A0ABQ4XBR5_9ASTR
MTGIGDVMCWVDSLMIENDSVDVKTLDIKQEVCIFVDQSFESFNPLLSFTAVTRFFPIPAGMLFHKLDQLYQESGGGYSEPAIGLSSERLAIMITGDMIMLIDQ